MDKGIKVTIHLDNGYREFLIAKTAISCLMIEVRRP